MIIYTFSLNILLQKMILDALLYSLYEVLIHRITNTTYGGKSKT